MADVPKQDIIERAVGKFGIWQLWISMIIIFSKFPSALYQGSVVYVAPHMDFICLDPDVRDPEKVCAQHCNKLEFDRHIFRETIVTEFELVCVKKYLVPLTHTVFMIGNGLGNMTAGVLADRYGRKKIFFNYVVVHFLAVVATILSPYYELFIIFRFISGFGTGGLGIGLVIILETVGGKYREVVSFLYLLTFPLGLMILAVLAYFHRSWRHLYTCLAIISTIIVITTYFVPESARYLLVSNKIDECVAILEKGAKQNRLPTENIRAIIERENVENPKTPLSRPSLQLLVTHKPLRLRMFICVYIFFVSGIIYFGILQYIGRLDDDIYQSNFIGAMTGIPGLAVSMILTKYCRRKIVLLLSTLLVSLGMGLVVNFGHTRISVLFAALSLFGLSVLVPAMTIFIVEYFPTIVRSTAVGLSFSLSNFGSALSSFPPQLADYVLWGPPLFFAILSGTCIFLLLFVPETKGKPLPQTLDDVKN